MISKSHRARLRSLSLLSFAGVAGCASLLLAGCGGSGNGGGGCGASCPVQSYTVSVQSTNPATGVQIEYGPPNTNVVANGTTSFTVTKGLGTTIVFSAPATAGGNNFSGWTGCTSATGMMCSVTFSSNATITANYATAVAPTVTVTPPTANVTIGSSQTLTAAVSGLSPGTVTWSVAVASGTGDPGTISAAGVYQSPYPAPASVTVTATSTANSAIKGTATITLVAPATAAGPALTVDAAVVTRAINPLIYGANAYLLDAASAQAMGITVARWGGDATSRYNYQNANSNSAADYYFQNGGAYAMLTTNSNSVNSEGNFNDFIAETAALGIESIGTAPVLGYVSNSSTSACSFTKATYPNQTGYDPSGTCGNGIIAEGQPIPNTSPSQTCTTAGGCSFLGNATTWQTTSLQEPPPSAPGAGNASGSWAKGTWAGGWVSCLLSNGAPCADAAGKDATIWDLDNEPAWWDAVHRDVHPSPSTYDEVTNGEIGTALAIKTVDASAKTSGPVIDYWWNYFYSKQDIENGWGHGPCYQPWDNPTDRAAHAGVPMIVYYLQQMAAASNTYGMPLLDYLTIHSYSAATYNGASVGLTTAGDTGEQQARMNSTRALWDPTYTDASFPQPNYTTDANYYSKDCNVPLQAPEIIPMMQGWVTSGWTGTSYAAPKLSIDEYNFGGTESINGAVTQADVLGIFGEYGLDMGVFWPASNYSTQVPGDMAFAIYRNYDGNRSRFGDRELSSTTADQGKLAVYAASRTSDGAMTIVVINKTYGSLTDTVSIDHLGGPALALVYQYSNANLNAIVALPSIEVAAPASGSTASTMSATFPAQSITLFVIPQVSSGDGAVDTSYW